MQLFGYFVFDMNYLSTILAPHFVGVYEFGNHIYYFFSDLSEENRDDGSRVGSDLNFKSRLIFDLHKKKRNSGKNLSK